MPRPSETVRRSMPVFPDPRSTDQAMLNQQIIQANKQMLELIIEARTRIEELEKQVADQGTIVNG